MPQTIYIKHMNTAIEAVIKGTRDSGGHTASLIGQPVPDTGYMVGGVTDSLIFGADLIMDESHHDLVAEKIRDWIYNRYDVATTWNTFIGGWIDTEEGVAYIDISEWYPHQDLATVAANAANEIAIWDLANQKEIRVK